MQTFKFRAYDPKKKAYYTALTDVMFENSPQGIYSATFLSSLGDTHQRAGEELIFEQWTGLQDKEKTDIFGGDLVAIDGHPKEIYEVRWNQSSCSYALWDLEKETQQMLCQENETSYLVIGTIHDRAILTWPIIGNPWFEKYRKKLGEDLFQEFAEYTESRVKEDFSSSSEWAEGDEKLWMYRLGFFNDTEVELFLKKRTPTTKSSYSIEEQEYLDKAGLGLGGTSPLPYGER